jgi:hypothetical protein
LPAKGRCLQLCIHPDWRHNDDNVVHLFHNLAVVTSPGLHSEPHVQIECELIDLSPSSTPPDEDESEEDCQYIDRDPQPRAPSYLSQNTRYLFNEIGFATSFVILLLLLSWLFLGNHPVWLISSSVTHSANYTFKEPLEQLQNGYGHDILPLITSLEHEKPIPFEPNQILGALCTELRVVLSGLGKWNESSIPNPDEVVGHHISECIDELDAIHQLYRSFWNVAEPLVKGVSLERLRTRLQLLWNERSFVDHDPDEDLFKAMYDHWSFAHESNSKSHDLLQQIHGKLIKISPIISNILQEFDVKLSPYKESTCISRQEWFQNSLDAANYSQVHLVPAAHTILYLINHALTTLSEGNNIAKTQLDYWDLMKRTKGTTRELQWTSVAPFPEWIVRRGEVTTQYSLHDSYPQQLRGVYENAFLLRPYLRFYPEWENIVRRPERPHPI